MNSLRYGIILLVIFSYFCVGLFGRGGGNNGINRRISVRGRFPVRTLRIRARSSRVTTKAPAKTVTTTATKTSSATSGPMTIAKSATKKMVTTTTTTNTSSSNGVVTTSTTTTVTRTMSGIGGIRGRHWGRPFHAYWGSPFFFSTFGFWYYPGWGFWYYPQYGCWYYPWAYCWYYPWGYWYYPRLHFNVYMVSEPDNIVFVDNDSQDDLFYSVYRRKKVGDGYDLYRVGKTMLLEPGDAKKVYLPKGECVVLGDKDENNLSEHLYQDKKGKQTIQEVTKSIEPVDIRVEGLSRADKRKLNKLKRKTAREKKKLEKVRTQIQKIKDPEVEAKK